MRKFLIINTLVASTFEAMKLCFETINILRSSTKIINNVLPKIGHCGNPIFFKYDDNYSITIPLNPFLYNLLRIIP